jgi:hypothetical protein
MSHENKEEMTIARNQLVTAASPLQQDILKVLSYFDIFQHPLTAEEIYAFLPSNSTTPQHIAAACARNPLNALVSECDGYYALTGDCSRRVAIRREKEQRAQRYWKVATRMASIIRRFPFVRAVFVSGELAKGVASENSDVDFVIVTANNRLWICRTLLIVFKKVVLLNSKKYCCLNHFVAERCLEVQEQNLYTALEIVTLRPLHNSKMFDAYLNANRWLQHFFPNYQPRKNGVRDSSRSVLQRITEFFFPESFATRLDSRLMDFWKRVWARRYPDLSDEKRNEIFRCTPDLSTAYHGDYASLILHSYQERLQQFGLYG